MYGLENLILNESADSSWYNFGYWAPGEDRYERACRQLACVLSDAAGFDREEIQSVFDVGGGCGDQQILWLQEYGLQYIHAVNPSAVQADFASAKLRRAGLNDFASIEVGALGSAASSNSRASRRSYDCVVALDAAYHIDKELFFSESARLCGEAGRLAFTDLTIGPGAERLFSRLILRLVCASGGISFRRIGDADALVAAGRSQGWRNIKFIDITSEVFGGYARFMRDIRGRLFRRHGLKSLRFIVAGFAIEGILRRNLLRYVLVIFQRTGNAP